MSLSKMEFTGRFQQRYRNSKEAPTPERKEVMSSIPYLGCVGRQLPADPTQPCM